MSEPRSALSSALLVACTLACEAAWAQPAPQPSTVASAAERAQKETDRTMYWIRVLADKPAPVKVVPASKTTAVAAAKSIAEARGKVKVPVAPTPAAASSAQDASGAAVPQTVAQTPNSAHSSVGTSLDSTALSGGTAEDATVANAATLPDPGADQAPAAESDSGLVQIKSIQPAFPTDIVRRIHKGNVEVRFEVEPGGTVVDAVVVESSHPRLNGAAVEAVKQWRFKPALNSHTALVNLVFDVDTER